MKGRVIGAAYVQFEPSASVRNVGMSKSRCGIFDVKTGALELQSKPLSIDAESRIVYVGHSFLIRRRRYAARDLQGVSRHCSSSLHARDAVWIDQCYFVGAELVWIATASEPGEGT